MHTGQLAMRHQPMGPGRVSSAPLVSSTRLAMMILICAETMLFAGFVGAYLVFRLKAHEWPPVNQPRLPVPITVVNTLVLFASAWPLTRALRAVRRPHAPELSRLLWITTALGVVFLAVQGREWVGLVAHGLTLGSSVYGGTFYLLIGCHGIHVLTAVGWLVVVAARASRGAFSPARFAGVEMCAMYWYFVCGLWAGLFPLVYLY